MKLFVVLALVAMAAAAPQQRNARQNPADPQVLRQEYENSGEGFYRFFFEQSDGQKHESQGELKNKGTENEALSVRGSYSWVDPNGVLYTVTYLADENGYQPTIEQGPGGGVPSAVLASLVG